MRALRRLGTGAGAPLLKRSTRAGFGAAGLQRSAEARGAAAEAPRSHYLVRGPQMRAGACCARMFQMFHFGVLAK